MVLPEPARLRPVVPEYGAEVVESHGLRKVVHSVFEVRAAHGGGALRSQGDQVATPVLEGVGLLLDDVGDLSDAADEQARVLEHRGVDALVAEPGGHIFGPGPEIVPVGLLFRQTSDVPLGAWNLCGLIFSLLPASLG